MSTEKKLSFIFSYLMTWLYLIIKMIVYYAHISFGFGECDTINRNWSVDWSVLSHMKQVLTQNIGIINHGGLRYSTQIFTPDMTSTGIDADASKGKSWPGYSWQQSGLMLKMWDTGFISTPCHCYLSMINWIMPNLHVVIPMESDGP